jgi:hypothetical protein
MHLRQPGGVDGPGGEAGVGFRVGRHEPFWVGICGNPGPGPASLSRLGTREESRSVS